MYEYFGNSLTTITSDWNRSPDVSSYQSAPNISLNLQGAPRFKELHSGMIFGILLQLRILVLSGLAVYHPKLKLLFPKDGGEVQSYAYPVMASGTIILIVGILLYSLVVEQSTQDRSFVVRAQQESITWKKGTESGAWLLWLQRQHTANDQTFEPFVLFAQDKLKVGDQVMTSTRRSTTHNRSSLGRTKGELKTPQWALNVASLNHRHSPLL